MTFVNTTNFFLEDCNAVIEKHLSSLTKLKNSSIVITGASGFMGSWLAGVLFCLNENFSFNLQISLVARNFKTFKNNHSYLIDKDYIHYFETDIKDYSEFPPDSNWIIHAAGNPDRRYHAMHPIETMRTIGEGSQNVLSQACRLSDLNMLLHVSSGFVYGDALASNHHFSESDHSHIAPSNNFTGVYLEAKRYAESLCHAYRSQYGTPITIARPFAFLGPYQELDKPWALNNFIFDAFHGRSIKVLGDGQSFRSYLYGSDMALFLLVQLVNAESGSIYNIGSDQPIHLENIAKSIAAEISPSPEIKLSVSPNSNKTSCFVPDVSHFQNDFKIRPTVNLKTAITKTILWYKLIQK